MVAVVDWSEWAEGEWVNIMILSSTTATTIIINEWAVGERVNNDGGGGNIDNIDGGGGNDITSFSLSFENLEILSHFAADLRGVTYDLVESSGKRWIFGLDSTINR